MNDQLKRFDKFSDLLRYVRWHARISQKGLADQMETSQTCVSAWEVDRALPTYPLLKKLNEFIKKNDIPVSLF